MAEPGEQQISIDMSELPAGLYICRISIDNTPVFATKIMKTGSGN